LPTNSTNQILDQAKTQIQPNSESTKEQIIQTKLKFNQKSNNSNQTKIQPSSNSTKLNQTQPNSTKLNQTQPNSTKLNQTQPNSTK
jgi:hypothetical protein